MMTDNSEMMGTAPMLTEKDSALYDTSVAKLVQQGKATEAFTAIAGSIISGKIEEIQHTCGVE